MNDLAAALLRDAIISGMRIATETPIEQVPAAIADVLAALSRALDPALSERAGEVLPRLRKADEYEPLGHDGWEAADLITALLAQNAALRAERDELSSKLEVERALTDAVHRLAKSAKAQIAFTATDGQRLLRKIDVIGVCDDPDFCFDSEGSVARCGPCAVKIAARDGVVLNEYTRSNPQAMRLRRELTAAEAQIAALTAQVERLTGALDDLLDAITASDKFGDRALTITGSTANLKWLLEAEEDARAALTETATTEERK